MRWTDMAPKDTFGACCQHLLLKTTFVAKSKKWPKKDLFWDHWVQYRHLAGNNFGTKILLKTGLLASKLCNSPFFMTQSAYSAVLCIFVSKKFQKKSKNFLPNLA